MQTYTQTYIVYKTYINQYKHETHGAWMVEVETNDNIHNYIIVISKCFCYSISYVA